jgi:RNA polymerase sigma factor FliA
LFLDVFVWGFEKESVAFMYSDVFPWALPEEELYNWLCTLAWKLKKKMCLPQGVEELIGEGYIGYDHALKHYDPNNGAKFKIFAEFRIVGQMKDYVRNELPGKKWKVEMHGPRPKVVSLDEYMDHDSNDGLLPDYPHVMDCTSYIMDHDPILKKKLRHSLSKLPTKIYDIIVRKYYDDECLKEIGESYLQTESRMSQLHSKGLLLMKRHMNKKGGNIMSPRNRSGVENSQLIEALKDNHPSKVCVMFGIVRNTLHYRADHDPFLKDALSKWYGAKREREQDPRKHKNTMKETQEITMKETQEISQLDPILYYKNVLDFLFKEHDGLLEALEKEAVKELRTPQNQLIWIVRRALGKEA